jgi:hypothetical protein
VFVDYESLVTPREHRPGFAAIEDLFKISRVGGIAQLKRDSDIDGIRTAGHMIHEGFVACVGRFKFNQIGTPYAKVDATDPYAGDTIHPQAYELSDTAHDPAEQGGPLPALMPLLVVLQPTASTSRVDNSTTRRTGFL